MPAGMAAASTGGVTGGGTFVQCSDDRTAGLAGWPVGSSHGSALTTPTLWQYPGKPSSGLLCRSGYFYVDNPGVSFFTERTGDLEWPHTANAPTSKSTPRGRNAWKTALQFLNAAFRMHTRCPGSLWVRNVHSNVVLTLVLKVNHLVLWVSKQNKISELFRSCSFVVAQTLQSW